MCQSAVAAVVIKQQMEAIGISDPLRNIFREQGAFFFDDLCLADYKIRICGVESAGCIYAAGPVPVFFIKILCDNSERR